MDSASEDPRDSGEDSQSQIAVPARASLRARLMRKFSVAVRGKKKGDAHRSAPSRSASSPLNIRGTVPLSPTSSDGFVEQAITDQTSSEPSKGTLQIGSKSETFATLGDDDEPPPPPKPPKPAQASTSTTTTTNSAASSDSAAPPVPPNKPKPRGSVLARMRRASRGAAELLSPAVREREAQSTTNDAKDEKSEHPRPGGLQALRSVFSGRKLGASGVDLSANKDNGESITRGVEGRDAANLQRGTVKSLVSQANSKTTTSKAPIPNGPVAPALRSGSSAGRAVRFDDKVKASGGKNESKDADQGDDNRSLGSTGSRIKFDDSAYKSGRPMSVKGSTASDDGLVRSSSGSLSQRMSKKQSAQDKERMLRKSISSKYRTITDGLELSLHEQAFMPGDLLKRLGASAGQLPPAPSVFSGQGAVLFVDVSGFTKLAERLNKDNVPVKASEKLAATITRVLEVLAQVCLDCGGEIGKFAGDALLCVWESNDLNKAELLAKHCAQQMLIEMENLNRIEKVELQIHGGVAKGSIVHFHFGSDDDDLRWYLVSGEAVAAATTLVDVALAGEFCCQEGIAKGLPSILDENDVSPRADGRKGVKMLRDTLESGNMFGSFRGFKNKQNNNDKDPNAPRHTKSLARGKKQVPTTFLCSTSQLPARPEFPKEHSNIAAVLKDGLPRSCNVYIPASLRDQLNERSVKKGEMRRRIACMFVEIGSLVMTEEELLKQTVSDAKLDGLNNAFVTMTRIVHAFEGEVRDMLFDDKGCVYIAIFGAHCEEEKEHHPWNVLAVKAAMAIVNEVPSARIGVSIGTCFVGMAGVIERRTDFVVVGHEVNMSARYMSNARPGQVLVSSGIHGSTKEQIKYGPEIQIMVGKGEYAKQRMVYSPLEESHRRASFQATYRRSMSGQGLFVGRQAEIDAIESNMNKIANGRSGVMVIESPPGRGKTTIVTRAKRMGRGKIKVVSGQALSTERNTPYFAFRQVLEAYTGIRPSMTGQEARVVIERIESGKGEKINVLALAQVLPWINDGGERQKSAGPASEPGKSSKDQITPERVADTFLQIIRLNFEKISEKSALIVLEDVQWMDKESLEMLTRLVEGLEKFQRVAILMTFRVDPNENNADNPFEAMEYVAYGDDPDARQKESQRKELIQTLKAKARKLKFNSLWIDLPPLTKADLLKLSEKLLGGEPNELSLQKLYDQTKGDPFYFELLAQWLMEKNMIRQEKGGTISVACDPASFPKSSEELIHIRCGQLSEDFRRILQLAASAGEIFDALYISAVSKNLATSDSRPGDALNTDQVLTGLHAAADIELVTRITDSTLRDEAQHKWRFKHDLIYRAIWMQVISSRRTALDRVAAADRKKLALRLKTSFFDNQGD